MKFFFAIITTFFLSFQAVNLDAIRDFYPKASATKATAAKFAAMVDKAPNETISNAYKNASKIILAKFETGPNRKTLITNGIKGLESTINSNPKNLELRVIRLSIQENLPKIIGYNSKIKEDKALILKNYSSQNATLKQYIKTFSVSSKSMTAAEKASLK